MKRYVCVCVCVCVCVFIYIYIYIYVTHTMEYYSAIKKEQNNVICSDMDGPRNGYTE